MIRVREAGLLTTVQDLGRPGLAHLGVPTAGAADRRAYGLANRLVGNQEGAAVLEITVAGPELELEAGGWVALTGGRVAADLDGRPVPMDVAVRVEPGQLLRVGTVTSGLRAYLAVRGGIDVAPVLGSRSTDTLAQVGPRPLEEGASLPPRRRLHLRGAAHPDRRHLGGDLRQ
jgi:allophanate hydrolase subunit 2